MIIEIESYLLFFMIYHETYVNFIIIWGIHVIIIQDNVSFLIFFFRFLKLPLILVFIWFLRKNFTIFFSLSSSTSLFSSISYFYNSPKRVAKSMDDKSLDSKIAVALSFQIQFNHLRNFTTKSSFWKTFPRFLMWFITWIKRLSIS